MNPFSFFVDPVLRAPTMGSMLMCAASSLIGVFVFIRRRSLLGETLSHASYPGVVLSVLCAASFFPNSDEGVSLLILLGAFLSSMLGLFLLDFLEKRKKVKSDAALCFILAMFFGIGVLIASHIQSTHALWYKQIQAFLYGQTATMTNMHVELYALLLSLSLFVTFLFYHTLKVVHFDREYALTIGIPLKVAETLIFFLFLFAIVVGIRSVGVVLMSGMLVAPVAAARQWTSRLAPLLVISSCFGVASGFLGNYLSVIIPLAFSHGREFSLPTGPMILLVAAVFCVISFMCAPKTGLLSRSLRVLRFKHRCLLENLLKAFWKRGEHAEVKRADLRSFHTQPLNLSFLLWRLRHKGWLEKCGIHTFRLTPEGWYKATRLVRVHRLWEAYLVYLGQGAEKVHKSAEEIEHLMTPTIEKELVELLRNPAFDPHQQPIPKVDV